jgi:hypothetical protein
MAILKDKSELIHFLKGSPESFSKNFLIPIKKDYKNWCPFANHGAKVDANCYAIFGHETGWIEYLEYFVWSIKYLTGDNDTTTQLNELVKKIADSNQNKTANSFENNLDQLITNIKRVEIEIKKQLDRLTCLECRRLGESITCLKAGCFRSATVMAVSAVEARLHTLISKKNARLYKKHFNEVPLGGVIKLFSPDNFKGPEFKNLKKILPEKHKPLLDIINTYRIFSAHPKNEEIDFRIAETVVNLSFLFLLDKDLEIKDKKTLIC